LIAEGNLMKTMRGIAILGLLLVGCGGEAQEPQAQAQEETVVAVRYPNLPALGSDVPVSVKRAFAELSSFFESLKTLNPDGINRNLASVIFQRDNGNDRNPAAITPPTVASDGTAVDHTISTDSSANISFEWSWTGNEADIDGWTVYVRSSTSSTAYDIGTTPAEEQTFQLPADRRSLILRGQPANLYYTFGVRAFRNVDLVIAPNGLVESPLVQPSAVAEDPYQPAANVAFTGDITGTTAWGTLGDLAVLDTVGTPQISSGAVTDPQLAEDNGPTSLDTTGVELETLTVTPATTASKFLLMLSASVRMDLSVSGTDPSQAVMWYLYRQIGAGTDTLIASDRVFSLTTGVGSVPPHGYHSLYTTWTRHYPDAPNTTDSTVYRLVMKRVNGNAGFESIVYHRIMSSTELKR
jgi:hypothetical protein